MDQIQTASKAQRGVFTLAAPRRYNAGMHPITTLLLCCAASLVTACGGDDDGARDTTTTDTSSPTDTDDPTETSDADATRDAGETSDAEDPGAFVLEYRFGNQIVGSTLTIDGDGVTERSERICCPPETTSVEAPDLDEGQLAVLALAVAAVAAENDAEETNLGTFPEGSPVGELYVYAEGTRYTVITYAAVDGDRVRVETTASEAKDTLMQIVNELVDQDIDD